MQRAISSTSAAAPPAPASSRASRSLTADDVGTRDSIAVVISPKPLDFKALNARITAQSARDYAGKLKAALGRSLDTGVRARTRDQLIELASSETSPDKVHALVIEFDKR